MIATQECVVPALRRMLDRQPLSPGKVRLAWFATVGQTIDRSTQVSLDEDGTLRVQARDRHWARELARPVPVSGLNAQGAVFVQRYLGAAVDGLAHRGEPCQPHFARAQRLPIEHPAQRRYDAFLRSDHLL